MSPQIHRTRWALAAAAAALTLVALPLTSLNAPPAEAGQGSGNPTMGAIPSTGLAVERGRRTVQVTGTDYLVPPHAAGTPVSGGIYVFFGWVDATKKWGPSGRNINNNDGNFGTTYLYPGDARRPGRQRTRARASATSPSPRRSRAAKPPSTSWTRTATGRCRSRFPAAPSGPTLPGTTTVKTTDCTKVTCGIFTIGAHGKTSATNEKFIPLKFGAGSTSTPTPTPKASPTPKPTTQLQPGRPRGHHDRFQRPGARRRCRRPESMTGPPRPWSARRHRSTARPSPSESAGPKTPGQAADSPCSAWPYWSRWSWRSCSP